MFIWESKPAGYLCCFSSALTSSLSKASGYMQYFQTLTCVIELEKKNQNNKKEKSSNQGINRKSPKKKKNKTRRPKSYSSPEEQPNKALPFLMRNPWYRGCRAKGPPKISMPASLSRASEALHRCAPRAEQGLHSKEDFIPKSSPELQLTGYKAIPVISCKGVFSQTSLL